MQTTNMISTIKKMIMFTVVVFLSIVIFSAKQNSDIVEKFTEYGASGIEDSELISEFTGCLKQRSPVLPLRSIECADTLSTNYGPTTMYRINVVFKTLAV